MPLDARRLGFDFRLQPRARRALGPRRVLVDRLDLLIGELLDEVLLLEHV